MYTLLDLDRKITLLINGSDSLMWDDAVYMATQTLTWIPIGLLILYVVYRSGGLRLLLLVLGLILLGILVSDQLSSSLVKPLVRRWRPTQDPHLMYLIDIVRNYRGGRFGFFSAHASNTFCVATFLALVFRHRLVVWLFFSWAMLNCYTRVYLGVHYFGDILAGVAVGLTVGYFVYRLYLFLLPRILSESDAPTIRGRFRENDLDMLSVGIIFTYCLLFVLPNMQ